MKFRQWIVLTALLMVTTTALNAQTAAVKTNLIGWATTNLNIGAELGVGRKSTVQIFGTLNPWDFGNLKRYRFWNVMPEYRYFFCEKFNGHFVGIHALGGQYNMRNVKFPPIGSASGFPDLTNEENGPMMTNDGVMKARHVEGWYVGAGLTYGYQWMLSKRWNLEAEIGAGYAYSPLKLYGRCNTLIEEKKISYFGLTKVGLSIMYMF